MSIIEFPNASILTGKTGELGLMVWSRLRPDDSIDSSDRNNLNFLNIASIEDRFYSATKSASLEPPKSYTERAPDLSKPDSFWLESELVFSSPLSRKFLLAWSSKGRVLARVQWKASLSHDVDEGCAIEGSVFSINGCLPVLSSSALIERVARSIEYARIMSSSMPCMLSLDRISVHEAHATAKTESSAFEQVSQLGMWQEKLGLENLALSDHCLLARSAKTVWLSKDPEGLLIAKEGGLLRRSLARFRG